MNRKRTLLPPAFKNKKKICTGPPQSTSTEQSHSAWNDDDPIVDLKNGAPTDTKAALLLLKSIFPLEKFDGRLPPIILTHQLYSIINSRTVADKELGELRESGEIRLFKLGTQTDDYCVIFTDDYISHVRRFIANLNINGPVLDKFLNTVVPKSQDVSVNKATMLTDFQFKDEEITQLIKASVLTVRDVGSWWMSIPGAGIFMKSFTRGRKSVLTTIRKCKYREILQKDLEERKLPKVAKLGMMYHIHDLIGADLVECIATTSGRLLRLTDI